jgi:gas vesicle protein
MNCDKKWCDENFKKGLLIGGLLAGVLVAFGMSKKGKELREKVLEYSEDLYNEVRRRALEWGETTREAYDEIVGRVGEEFARRKGMALEMKNTLVERLKEKWDEFQVDMLFGKVKNRFKDAADKSREGFDRVVHEVVDEYEKRKDLSGLIKYRLVRNLKRKWDELKEGVVDRNDEGWR